jgi:hypothetical protein
MLAEYDDKDFIQDMHTLRDNGFCEEVVINLCMSFAVTLGESSVGREGNCAGMEALGQALAENPLINRVEIALCKHSLLV